MSVKILAFIAAVMMAATPAYGRPAVTGKTYVDQSYDRVRVKLIRRGFYPIKIKHNGEYEVDVTCYDGFCEKYPEAIMCSGAGMQGCLMAYKSHSGKYLIVTTIGEGDMKVLEMRYADADDVKEIKSHNR